MARTVNPAWLLLCAMLLLPACSNVETPDLKRDVEEEKIIPPGWQPIALRVGLAPFRSALELDEKRYNVEDTNRWVLTPDEQRLNGPAGLHGQMLQVLRDYRMFEQIGPVEGASATTARPELQQMALRQGLDVVIVPTVRRQDVGYVDSNGAYGWNMFVWWMVSPIFSWFIADEDFDANLHVELKLYPATTGDELLATRLQPPEAIVRSLDDFDHGFNLFSIFGTPGYMDGECWQKVGGLLMPIAENEAKKAALRYATRDLSRRVTEQGFLQGIRRRVALVAGVDGTGQPPVPLSRFASADAQSLAAQALEAENDAVPEAAMRTLFGARATRRALDQAADELASLARYNDDVLLAFCGVGNLDDQGRPMLVLAQPAGPLGGKPEQVVLAELVERLIANRPRTLTLYLDCSFTAPGDKRCAATEEQVKRLPTGRSVFQAVVDRCKEAGVPCLLLSATDGLPGNPHGMKALEIEDLGHGLFSAFAVEALAGQADKNSDRQVTVEEFSEYVGSRVAKVAELEGEGQRSHVLVPTERKGYGLPAWRR